MTSVAVPHTINIVAAALGGEGGGVFTNWLIDVAEANNWLSQTTSLAGVAQRTGATIYYIELFPREQASTELPVMSLFPAQGDIDIAISSEIAEAGRMLQRGFITPDRTTLISSTHRVFGITEKSHLGDGTMDPTNVLKLAEKYAKQFVRYDMAKIASTHNAVISAVMLGALAGSGALPFSKQSFTEALRNTGKDVATNMAAFEASYAMADSRAHVEVVETFDPHGSNAGVSSAATAFNLPVAQTAEGKVLLDRVRDSFPVSTQEIIYHGIKKAIEYQDHDYATQYLDEVATVLDKDTGAGDYELTGTTARYLALWMCFEDIPRVAQLKIRQTRMAEIRQEVQADAGQIIYVTEFFRPRPEEICALMPAAIGGALLTNKLSLAVLNRFAGGKKLRTNTLSIYLSLRFLASLRRFRRRSLGYRHEFKMINDWLTAVKTTAGNDINMAQELAKCGQLVKGYGETRTRTTNQLMAIVERCGSQKVSAATAVSELHRAALADDNNTAFERAMASAS